MGARGIYVAQECHVVNLIPPASYSTTQTSALFSMKGWEHATIIIQQGSAGTPPVITLESSDNGSPANTTAIPFNLHKCETAYNAHNGDVLGPRIAVTSAGFTPAADNDVFYVIELDANTLPEIELGTAPNVAPDSESWVALVATSPTSWIANAVVILSAGRYEHDQSETVLTF